MVQIVQIGLITDKNLITGTTGSERNVLKNVTVSDVGRKGAQEISDHIDTAPLHQALSFNHLHCLS